MTNERLPTFLKISWGVGATGTTSMLYLINLFLIYFLVRHVGMSAAVAEIVRETGLDPVGGRR